MSSGASDQISVANIPSAPQNLQIDIVCEGSDASLTWNSPAAGSVTHYTYKINTGSEVNIGNTTSTTISGLNMGDTVTITAYLDSCIGGNTSETATVIGKPTLNLVADGCDSYDANLTWNNIAGATNYRVEWSTDGSFATSSSDTTSNNWYNVTGLSQGSYFWRVKAISPQGL